MPKFVSSPDELNEAVNNKEKCICIMGEYFAELIRTEIRNVCQKREHHHSINTRTIAVCFISGVAGLMVSPILLLTGKVLGTIMMGSCAGYILEGGAFLIDELINHDDLSYYVCTDSVNPMIMTKIGGENAFDNETEEVDYEYVFSVISDDKSSF